MFLNVSDWPTDFIIFLLIILSHLLSYPQSRDAMASKNNLTEGLRTSLEINLSSSQQKIGKDSKELIDF